MGACSKLVMIIQYNTANFLNHLNEFNPYKDNENSQYINLYNKIYFCVLP